jgi:hypothetical protein
VERLLVDARALAAQLQTDARDEAEQLLAASAARAEQLDLTARDNAGRLWAQARSEIDEAMSEARTASARLLERTQAEADELLLAAHLEAQQVKDVLSESRAQINDDVSRMRRARRERHDRVRDHARLLGVDPGAVDLG